MGQAPNLLKVIKTSTVVQNAIQNAIDDEKVTLNNNEDAAYTYIAKQATIIPNGKIDSSTEAYSKFAEDYSLDALEKVIDPLIEGSVSLMAGAVAGEDPEMIKLAEQTIRNVGGIVKAVIGLFSSSGSVDKAIAIQYSNLRVGTKNYAIYHSCNSGQVKGDNAWGGKSITVVSNMYLLIAVEPNENFSYAEIFQGHLDALVTLEKQFDNAIINATNQDELNGITFFQNKIDNMKQKISSDLEALRTGKPVSISKH